LEQRNRLCGSRLCEHAGVLPDGHRLPAGDDVLQPLRRRVLPGERDRSDAVSLLLRDHRACETVVGGCDRVDLVARTYEHLSEDRRRLLVVPAGYELIWALLEGAVRVQRLEDRVVPALEEERVRIRAAAVQL